MTNQLDTDNNKIRFLENELLTNGSLEQDVVITQGRCYAANNAIHTEERIKRHEVQNTLQRIVHVDTGETNKMEMELHDQIPAIPKGERKLTGWT